MTTLRLRLQTSSTVIARSLNRSKTETNYDEKKHMLMRYVNRELDGVLTPRIHDCPAAARALLVCTPVQVGSVHSRGISHRAEFSHINSLAMFGCYLPGNTPSSSSAVGVSDSLALQPLSSYSLFKLNRPRPVKHIHLQANR